MCVRGINSPYARSVRNLMQSAHEESVDWSIDRRDARNPPMGAKSGDKSQVPLQYGCQYKFDACNMRSSPKNLTNSPSIRRLFRNTQRNVIFEESVQWETAMRVS